jgi:hypothetical protein
MIALASAPAALWARSVWPVEREAREGHARVDWQRGMYLDVDLLDFGVCLLDHLRLKEVRNVRHVETTGLQQRQLDLRNCIAALNPEQTVGETLANALLPSPHLLLSSSNSRCICARMVLSSACTSV